jgi:hypothetical protein
MGLNTHSNPVLRFAYGYRDIITRDNARLNTMLPDARRWVVDLSAAGLWSHLNHWGRTGKLLSVRCDESKPLKSIAGEFTGGDDDPGIRQASTTPNRLAGSCSNRSPWSTPKTIPPFISQT